MELEELAEPDWSAEERANGRRLPDGDAGSWAADAGWPDEWADDDDPAPDWVDAYEL